MSIPSLLRTPYLAQDTEPRLLTDWNWVVYGKVRQGKLGSRVLKGRKNTMDSSWEKTIGFGKSDFAQYFKYVSSYG